MKKIFTFIVLFALIVSMLTPLTAEAEDDIEYVGGDVRISIECPSTAVLESNGIRFLPVDLSAEFGNVYFTATGLDSSGYKMLLNGKEICSLSSSGSAVIAPDMLDDGVNELLLSPVVGKSVYDESMVYGTYNIDDFDLTSFSLCYIDGTDIELELVKYLPVQGSAGYTTTKEKYDGKTVALGDGWNASTNLGGSTPNVPIMAGFRFDSSFGVNKTIFAIDTTLLPEGENVFRVYDTETKQYLDITKTIYVNNKAPSVEFGIGNGCTVTPLRPLKAVIGESVSGFRNAEVYVDDAKLATVRKSGEYVFPEKQLSDGNHTAYIHTRDKKGNDEYFFLFFKYSSTDVLPPVFNENGVSVSDGCTLHGVDLSRRINMYTNPMGEKNDVSLRNSFEELQDITKLGSVTTNAIGNAHPYQSFLIDVSDKTGENVVISCRAETGNGDDYTLSVFNHATSSWDVVGTSFSGEALTVKLNAEKYVKDGKVRARTGIKDISNSSDTILWQTDPQHYSTFEDLNAMYEAVMNYTAAEYQKGNIAYSICTGDVVDQAGTKAQAEKEYTFASGMQKIIDDAGVPNGVCAGNHDVLHKEYNYEYFHKYFPSSRYSSNEWYGGSLNNNECHFDLITVGGYDLLILYFGYGKNADADSIAWANAVLKAYPDRNAIIATHEYIDQNGKQLSDNAVKMWNEIVCPNENVKMVICGHSEGVCDQWREVEGTDRKVLEILHDYQFAEMNEGAKHVVNGMTCDGEAFLRLMTFNEAGQLIMKTYSPVYDLDAYYAPYHEDYVYDVGFSYEGRSITTKEFYAGVECEADEKCKAFFASSDDGKLSSLALKDFAYIPYVTDGEKIEYITDPEYVTEKWYAGIESTLERGSDNGQPDAEVYIDLLPESASSLHRSSGMNDYDALVNDDGSLTLTGTGTGFNWITLRNDVARTDITEHPYLFFSVDTDRVSKWGIHIITSKTQYQFSRDLYGRFGYKDYAVPSDIWGPWHGYIDFSSLLAKGESVIGVYLTAATPGSGVTFRYLFFGDTRGKRVDFVSGDIVKTVYAADTVEDPGEPYMAGKTFDGWYDGNGNKISFPYKPDSDITLNAKYTDRVSKKSKCEYYDTETEMKETLYNEESSPEEKENGLSPLVFVIIGVVVVAAASAAVLIAAKKKK